VRATLQLPWLGHPTHTARQEPDATPDVRELTSHVVRGQHAGLKPPKKQLCASVLGIPHAQGAAQMSYNLRRRCMFKDADATTCMDQRAIDLHIRKTIQVIHEKRAIAGH
jgi:hypothetical protein